MPKDWIDGWEQRRVAVRVTAEALTDLLKGVRTILIDSKIPADAYVTNISYDWQRHGFNIVFCHPSFGVVPEGAVIPLELDWLRMVVTDMAPPAALDCPPTGL